MNPYQTCLLLTRNILWTDANFAEKISVLFKVWFSLDKWSNCAKVGNIYGDITD